MTELTISDGTEVLSFSNSSSYSSPFADCPIEKLYWGRNISYNSLSSPFEENASLKTLIIGDNVTGIGKYAFRECTSLTELTIPNSVTEIGEDAFRECTGLTELTIGNSVTDIGSWAFYNCTSIKNVTSLNPTPPTLYSSSDFPTASSATLHVLEGCKLVYQQAYRWKDFYSIIDDIAAPENVISEKRTEAQDAYEAAMQVYEEYMKYYKGEGMVYYQQVEGKQTGNGEEAESILADMEVLEEKLTKSNLSDEDMKSHLTVLNTIKESVSALKDENNNILATNSFYGKVNEYYENVAAFYGRLSQYKERIETATTVGELNTLIAEIEQDARDIESSCLEPVASEYQGLDEIDARIDEISIELNTCKEQMQSLSDDIDAAVESAIAGRKADATEICQQAMQVYEEYMKYYSGEGMAYYQQVKGKQTGNGEEAESILADMEVLEEKLTKSNLSDEDMKSQLTALDTMKESVSALKNENGDILSGNSFYGKVNEYYENVAAFYGRLSQYKERIEAASTIDELDALIAEIEQDAKDIESSCLEPVAGEYQGLEEIDARLAEISVELNACREQMQSLSDDIDAAIDSAIAGRKADATEVCQQAMQVYEEYMKYYSGKGMAYYQQVEGKQTGNGEEAESILAYMELLEKKLTESGLSDEDMEPCLTALNTIKENVSALKNENGDILSDNSFYGSVNGHYDEVAAFYGRLSQYKERIEAASTIGELDALIAEIEQDAKDIESSCLEPVASEYQGLDEIDARLAEISVELEDYREQMQSLSEDIDAVITGIVNVTDAETEYTTVYSLNGQQYTVRNIELNSLPKGIYIVNGKKVIVK